MNTRFGRAFRYEVRNYFRAVAILWLVMALIPAAMLAITYFLAGETAMEGSFNGYSIAVGMFGLVLGMVGLRENQRVLNQNGVSRRPPSWRTWPPWRWRRCWWQRVSR